MNGIWMHLFLPHKSNNHRAKVLQIDALFVYLLFFALFNFATKTIHKEVPQVLGYATDIYSDQLLIDVNKERNTAGLPPLNLNQQLSQAAAAKAQYMFEHNFWAHNSPDGHTPWEFITAAGYKYSIAGENLAKNFNNSQGVVDAWMASPSHRENILKSGYKDVGFAVVNGVLNGEETTLVVQMFGSTNTLSMVKQNPVVPAEAAKTVEIPAPTAVPVEVKSPVLAENPIPLAESPSLKTGGAVSGITNLNTGISLRPLIDLNIVTRTVSYLFVGLLGIVFLADAYIVSRKKIVRITGHNIAHILFLISLSIALTLSVPGVIL
jgi:uncharacterized protein YkwD